MKKSLLSVTVLGALSLAGCTAYGDQLGSILGTGYNNGNYYGMGGPTFQQSAVDGCAYQAQRYGRVSIGNVQQVSGDTMRVYGTIDLNSNYQRRPFACSFRADGRITDFDID